jgi:hypothetical protein
LKEQHSSGLDAAWPAGTQAQPPSLQASPSQQSAAVLQAPNWKVPQEHWPS